MQKAFLEDIRREGERANCTREPGGAQDRGVEGDPGERQERRSGRRVKGTMNWEGGGLEAPLRSSDNINESVTSWDRQDTNPAGGALKTYIKDVLPEMAIRLAAIEK